MIYNTTHKEYRLGLGLFFKLVFGHISNPAGWTAISNIPALNYKKLESDNEEDCIYEVMAQLQSFISFVYDPAEFKHLKK